MKASLPASVCTLLTLACACSKADERAFQDLGEVQYEEPSPVSARMLRFEASVGQADGELAFSNIPDVAVSHSGILAILDRFNCQVALVDSTGELRARLGRCGRGPGELVVPWRVEFQGDSLIIFDSQLGAMLVWDLLGNEGRRLILDQLPGASGVRDIAVVDDSTLLIAKELKATAYTDDDQLVAILDLRTGRVRAQAVTDVPMSLASERAQARPVYLCADEGRHESGSPVVISNIWQPEIVSFARFPAEIAAHIATIVDWLPVRYDANGPTAPGIPYGEVSVACGTDMFIHVHRVLDYTRRPPAIREGLIEVRGYDGVLAFRRLWSESNDPVFDAMPRAARGNRYYFVDNFLGEYPAVKVYRLVQVEQDP